MPTVMAPSTVKATIQYFKLLPKHQFEKPYEVLIDQPDAAKDVPRSNLAFESVECLVEDARCTTTDFNLDTHGFTWQTAKTSADLNQRQSIINDYLGEVEELVKSTLGPNVKMVKAFNWRVRESQSREDWENKVVNLEDGFDSILPATYAHIDQSPGGALRRAQYHFPDEANELLKGRFRIINVWRPFATVENYPLALCDARTVAQEDMVFSDLVRRSYIGETCFLKYNPKHRWYYLSEQRKDEVTVLKIYDSEDVDGKFCGHSSFQLPGSEYRKSIEVRTIVFDHSKMKDITGNN